MPSARKKPPSETADAASSKRSSKGSETDDKRVYDSAVDAWRGGYSGGGGGRREIANHGSPDGVSGRREPYKHPKPRR